MPFWYSTHIESAIMVHQQASCLEYWQTPGGGTPYIGETVSAALKGAFFKKASKDPVRVSFMGHFEHSPRIKNKIREKCTKCH